MRLNLSELYLLNQVARHPEAVTVVTGIVGCAGLKVPFLC